MVIWLINQDKCNEALLFDWIKYEGQKMKQPIVGYVAHLQGVCLGLLVDVWIVELMWI